MKKVFKNFNPTFNEGVIFLVIIFFLLLKLLFQTPIWVADYQFWKVSDYLSEGVIPMNQSSLVIPKSEGASHCEDMKTLSGAPAFKNVVSIGGTLNSHGPFYCGCLNSDANSPVKYKLFKDKVVYQCQSEILVTQQIPASLEKQ